MTKPEAIAAMERGEKVTHRYFSPEEWMTILNLEGEIFYKFEDGVKCHPSSFWNGKIVSDWEDGYSIFKEPEKLKEPEL